MKAINAGYWQTNIPKALSYKKIEDHRPGLCSRRQAIAHAKKDAKKHNTWEFIALEDGTWLVWTGTALKKYANKDTLYVALALQGVTDFSEMDEWTWEDDTKNDNS